MMPRGEWLLALGASPLGETGAGAAVQEAAPGQLSQCGGFCDGGLFAELRTDVSPSPSPT